MKKKNARITTIMLTVLLAVILTSCVVLHPLLSVTVYVYDPAVTLVAGPL